MILLVFLFLFSSVATLQMPYIEGSVSDEKPIPTVIPDGIKKMCKLDPTFEVCKKFGLDKPKAMRRHQYSGEEEEEEITDGDMAVERDDEPRKEIKKRVDCKEIPDHPGCQRNYFLDHFIAMKIHYDCEVNPDGPYCPRKPCRSVSSGEEDVEDYYDDEEYEDDDYADTRDSEEETNPRPELTEEQKKALEDFFAKLLEAATRLSGTHPKPSSQESPDSIGSILSELLRSILEAALHPERMPGWPKDIPSTDDSTTVSPRPKPDSETDDWLKMLQALIEKLAATFGISIKTEDDTYIDGGNPLATFDGKIDGNKSYLNLDD